MKSLRSLLLLAAPTLLLVGCDQGATSSSPSVSPSESETPSQTESESSSDSGDSSDSSSSTQVAVGELTLDSFLSAIKAGNYTVVYDDSYIYADDPLDYYSYYLDESTVVYLTDYGDGSNEGSAVGNNEAYGLVQVDFADGQVYAESLVSPAKGVKIIEVYYTPADFLGEKADWTSEGSTISSDSNELKEYLLYFLGLDESMETADLGDLSLTLGEDTVSFETTIDGESFVMTFSDFGTTVYDGVEDMLSDVEFSVPTDWGIAATYADEFGIAFPANYFGYGFTATVDDYYGSIEVSDTTADASKFLSLMQGLLTDAGFVIDNEWSEPTGNYYSYYNGDNCVDFYWYEAEDYNPVLYPNGYVDILFYTMGF